MNPEREKEIIERIRDGEYGLYRELVLYYQDRLYSFILRFVSDEDDAKDICQEAFFKSYQSISKFRFKSKFSTWLFRIAYNISMTQLKKKAKYHETELYPDMIMDDRDNTSYIENNDLIDAINNALNGIRYEYRMAIHLFYVEEYSYKEISEIMKIPINSIKSNLKRGKELMGKILREKYDIENFFEEGMLI